MTAWTVHAARAAADRLAAGRALDAGFVAALEAEVVTTVAQTGEGALAALDGLHTGLAQAVTAPPCAWPVWTGRGRCRHPDAGRVMTTRRPRPGGSS